MKKPQTRTHVIKTLIRIQNGHSLNALLDGLLKEVGDDNKAFTHHLLLTSLRHWVATERLLDTLADNPIDEIEVRTSIQVGMTQLLYLEVADHASIFETVEAVKEIDFARASGLVNAILRKVAKNPNKYRKKCDKKHSLPNWLAKQLKQDWSEDYNQLCQNLRQPAPMFLRVNARQSSVEDYMLKLEESDISATIFPLTTQLNDEAKEHTTQPIRLHQSQAVRSLPAFFEGMVSVQDAHANIAGEIIKRLVDNLKNDDLKDNQIQVLDACTAPSGKLAHCLEIIDEKIMPSVSITAIDNEPTRLERSQQNLARLGFEDQANILCVDATDWQLDSDQPQQFDVILLDSPCTATGVIRRHPDIGLLRKETDIAQTVALQRQILDNLWSQLKAGGYLVYATCSILKAENETQMQDFVSHYDNATEMLIEGNWGIKQAIGRQCLPLDIDSGDGFYYAVLKKESEK